jgi:hypothetical protein
MSYLKCIAVILASSFAAPGFAAPTTFNLLTGQVDDSYLMSRNYSVGGIGLTVTGWSNNGTAVVQDKVGKWSGGLGVEDSNSGVPGHSVDSQNNDFDMLLLSFSDAVTLNSIDLGWIYQEDSRRSDVSIMAGTSALAAGASWATLLTAPNGWQTAGNYNNAGSSEKTVNLGTISSKYWLIGAYNPILGAAISNNDTYYEAFKLEGVKVTKAVPESSTLFLFGLGLLGLVAARRRAV